MSTTYMRNETEDKLNSLSAAVGNIADNYSSNITMHIQSIDNIILNATLNGESKIVVDIDSHMESVYPMIMMWYEYHELVVEKADNHIIISWGDDEQDTIGFKIGWFIARIVYTIRDFFTDIKYAFKEADGDGND